MPTFMTEQIARSLYERSRPYTRPIGAPYDPPAPITYGKEFFEGSQKFTRRAQQLVSLGVSGSVLVVGSGFGYLLEALVSEGVTDVWGIEPGDFYWNADPSEWADSMQAKTANTWIGSGSEKQALNSIGVQGAARFDWIIDEDASPAHADAELTTFISGLEGRLKGNRTEHIVHLTTTNRHGVGDSSQNWKSLEGWEQIAPSHTWIDAKTVDTKGI